jgi:hypothetical protein
MIKRLLRLWLIFLALTGLISCWFVGQAVKEGWKFVRLNTQVRAHIINWEIKMLSSSHYALLAHYSYSIDDQEFTGQTLFSSPNYLNYYAAANDLKARQGAEFWTWYQKNNPSFSSLQKKFPKKEFTNALLTIGVFIYFYFIRGMLERKNE